jgi:CheY-like chemotaxis protein
MSSINMDIENSQGSEENESPDCSKLQYILFVDDDEDQLFVFKTLLESRKQNRVVTASSAQEAKETLQQIHIDLVVCDVNMPEVRGTELVAQLRAAGDQDHLPAIMITANSNLTKEEALSCGADELVYKSQPKRLLACVDKMLKDNAENCGLLDKIQQRFVQ